VYVGPVCVRKVNLAALSPALGHLPKCFKWQGGPMYIAQYVLDPWKQVVSYRIWGVGVGAFEVKCDCIATDAISQLGLIGAGMTRSLLGAGQLSRGCLHKGIMSKVFV
jgi:hypothetical protein